MSWLRVKAAADYAGVSERLFRDWLKGGLRFAKVGGVVLIGSDWIDNFIMSREVVHDDAKIDAIVDELIDDL
jgi:hypothetical protein